jgi:hypothetical protein
LSVFKRFGHLNFQHTWRKRGLAGSSVPNDQRTLPEEIISQNRPRNVEATRVRNRSQTASAAQDGVHPEVHGLRNAVHNDEEEAQLQSLRNRKLTLCTFKLNHCDL